MGSRLEKNIFPSRFGCAYNQAANERFFTFTRFRAEERAIQFRVLGCAGGKAPGCHLTSFLINEELLLEGGSAASGLTIGEQARLTGGMVSHAHLDHIAELPYLADNIFGLREDSLKVIGARDVLEVIQESIFNNAVWPDFCEIRHEDTPILDFSAIGEMETRSLGGIRIMPYAVDHKGTTFGFIFEDAECALLYTSDTGPTEAIWRGAGPNEQSARHHHRGVVSQQDGGARAHLKAPHARHAS